MGRALSRSLGRMAVENDSFSNLLGLRKTRAWIAVYGCGASAPAACATPLLSRGHLVGGPDCEPAPASSRNLRPLQAGGRFYFGNKSILQMKLIILHMDIEEAIGLLLFGSLVAAFALVVVLL